MATTDRMTVDGTEYMVIDTGGRAEAFSARADAAANGEIIGAENNSYSALKDTDGWANPAVFFTGRTFEREVSYRFIVDLSPAPAESTYFFIQQEVDGEMTEILNRQMNGLSHLDIRWKPTETMDNIRCIVGSSGYRGACTLNVQSHKTDNVTENTMQVNAVADAQTENVFSILSVARFDIGGNYGTSYNYDTGIVSCRDIITATGDWFLRVDPSYQASITFINSDESTTFIDWFTNNYFIPNGQRFVIRIRQASDGEIADIKDAANKVTIYNTGKTVWHNATDYCDSLEQGKTIRPDGSVVSAGGYYWHLYTFKNPQFKRIMAKVSSTSSDVVEIAFYNDSTIGTNTFDAVHSSLNERGYRATDQLHCVAADVPEDCKTVCVCTRNILNDNTAFSPEIYVDNLLPYEIRANQQRAYAIPMFNDYKYVCHIFAEKIGSGNYLIPCQSMAYIDIAHRLGYRMIELNVHKTATPGVYVCLHGNGGTIGDELVARNGDDISGLRFENITAETFMNDYVYNTTDERFRTRITFLDEALIACKRYNMVPMLGWADYEMLDVAQKYVGNNFVVITYNDYYLQRRIFKGVYNRYGSVGSVAEIDAMCKKIGFPFIYGFDSAATRELSAAQVREIVDTIHDNGCFTGFAGVYESNPTIWKMENAGVDFDATGYGVEYFDSGNLVNLHSNNTFADFYTQGTVTNSILALQNDQYLSSDVNETPFLSKAILQIRFSGTIKLTLGDYVYEEPITSDGVSAVEISTFFVNRKPNFTVQAAGNVRVFECNYWASDC